MSSVLPIYHKTCTEASGEDWPLETFCTGNSTDTIDKCVARAGFPLICNGYLQGIVTRSCDGDGIMQYTDVSQNYFWIFIKQLKEQPYKLIDNEYLRTFLFGTLDFFAWVIGTPSVADKFEIIKFMF